VKAGVLMHAGTVLAAVEVTETALERARGLLGRAALPAGHAMWFERCACVHTCGMRFAIDVVFLDRRRRVVRIRRGVRPWRLVWGGWRASAACESAANALPLERLRMGSEIEKTLH
jgi:uncharacterized membrane protein (UPF0127 family)